jgi:hypothetical protein
VLRDHFHRFQNGGSQTGTRAIVFTNVRSSVDEILNHLKALEPMCRVGPYALPHPQVIVFPLLSCTLSHLLTRRCG